MQLLRFIALTFCLLSAAQVHSISLGSAFASKPVDPSSYKSVQTAFRGENQEAARLKIIKELKRAQSTSTRSQVILLPFSDSSGASASSVATGALKELVLSAGAEIIDRELPKAIKAEIIAYEQSGKSMGSSFELADYVFTGEVSTIKVSTEYDNKKQVIDQRGKIDVSGCVVSVQAHLTVKLYSMNPLAFENAHTLSQNHEEVIEHVATCEGADTHPAVIGAIQKALDRESATFKNYFAAKGYIVDHREGNKDKHIFKTTFNAAEGAAPNTKVVIYKTVRKKDPITLQENIEKAEVASGKVIAVKGDPNVWIKLDKKAWIDDIRLGDQVEVAHENCSTLSLTNNCLVQEAF